MQGIFGGSLWFFMVIVVPGFVSIATLSGAATLNPELASTIEETNSFSEGIQLGFAVLIMIATQYLGVTLEGFFIRRRWLGPQNVDIEDLVEMPFLKMEESLEINPYNEYRNWDVLIVNLADHEDTKGHMERALALFFLSINTFVSFLAGATLAIIILFLDFNSEAALNTVLYVVILLLLARLNYHVTVGRFQRMGRVIWSLKRLRRLKIENEANVST